MTPLSNKSWRVIALLSCLGAFVLYQSTRRQTDDLLVLELSQGDVLRGKESPESVPKDAVSFAPSKSGNETLKASKPLKKKEVQDEVCSGGGGGGGGRGGGRGVWRHPALKPSGGAFLKDLDLSRYSNEDQEYLVSRMEVMLSRTRRVSHYCQSHSRLAVSTPLQLIWHTNSSFVWCPLYKVLNEVVSSANHTVKDGRKVKELHKERNKVFKNSLRVIFVRDPYARLVSAYQDKIAKRNPSSKYFEALKRKITKEYGKPDKKSSNSGAPTFPQFVDYVLDSTRLLHTVDQWIHKVHCWRPYWVQCNVCASDYDLIIKLETFEDDKKFLRIVANVTEFPEDKWSRNDSENVESNETLYLSQLDRTQLKLFYHQFLIDFELFDYPSRVDIGRRYE